MTARWAGLKMQNELTCDMISPENDLIADI